MLVSGIGLALSLIFIRFDDTRNIVSVLLLIFTYVTPIFYPLSKQVIEDGLLRPPGNDQGSSLRAEGEAIHNWDNIVIQYKETYPKEALLYLFA